MTEIIPQLIINGIIAGAIYSLAALGLTIIFGVLGFVNFGYGDLIMVGSYIFFVFLVLLELPIYIAAPLAVISMIILSFIIERLSFRPVRDKDPVTALIISVGIGFALRAIIEIIFKGQTRSYGNSVSEGIEILGGAARITPNQITIIAVSIICIVLLFSFLRYTKTGKAVRAVSDNRRVSEVIGININKHILYVFAISAVLAAVAGILLGYENYLHPMRGVPVGIKAFSAIILGGVGSLPGAMVGGFVIGLAENIIPGLGLVSTGYKESIAFFVLIIVMILRPRGIFGVSKSEEARKH